MDERVKTPIGEMWLADGVLFHRVDDLGPITADDAREVLSAVASVTGGKPVPAVIDIRAVGYASAEARETFGGTTAMTFETATALIVGPGPSRSMAQAFLKITKPQRPVEIFTDEAAAVAWARAQAEPDLG